MTTPRMDAGSPFPNISVARLGGGEVSLATPEGGHDWRLVIVYRGKHCPICTRYLTGLKEMIADFNNEGIDVVAVSGDPEEKAAAQMDEIDPNFTVGYGLAIEQMQQLGLFISHPRSPKETDRPFSEPGLFVINDAGAAQIIDISNAPFARPELGAILNGIKFIRNPENHYPVRGMYS